MTDKKIQDKAREVELKGIFEDLDRYQNAYVYDRLSKSKNESDKNYALGAMYNILKDIGTKKDLEGLVESLNASHQSRDRFQKYFTQRYEETKQKLTVGEYYTHNKEIIEGLVEEDEKSVAESLEKYKDESLKSLNRKIATLRHKMEDPNDEEGRLKAEEELKEYEGVSRVLRVIEDEMYAKLFPKAVKETNKLILKSHVEEYKSQKEQEEEIKLKKAA